MEKWGFGLSKKKSSGDDRPVCQWEQKYAHHSEEQFLVMICFKYALKERIGQVSKSHKTLKHAEKK
jgi:hypothetical protein